MTFEHTIYRDDAFVGPRAAADPAPRPTLLARLLTHLADRQRVRRTRLDIDKLDDRVLRDIGLTRYDLARTRWLMW